MSHLSDIEFFVQVARSNSLSEAARRLNVSPAAASAALKRLEADLGVKLMVRSTRNLRLTQEAEDFLVQCTHGLELIRNAREVLLAGQDVIAGQVQLSLPSDLGRQMILPLLRDFRLQYPNVKLRLQLSDRLASLHREPVDVALRYGEPLDSSLVALSVVPQNRRVLCASPMYLSRYGELRHPSDLRQHACLCFQLSDRVHNFWKFSRASEFVTVEVSGPIVSNDGDAIRCMALLGEGIVYKSYLDVAQDLKAGRLIALCTDWDTEPAPLYLACADRSQLRPVVKLLRDYLILNLK